MGMTIRSVNDLCEGASYQLPTGLRLLVWRKTMIAVRDGEYPLCILTPLDLTACIPSSPSTQTDGKTPTVSCASPGHGTARRCRTLGIQRPTPCATCCRSARRGEVGASAGDGKPIGRVRRTPRRCRSGATPHGPPSPCPQ